MPRSDLLKQDGFAFFVLGAASGIGKTTFGRRAFSKLRKRIHQSEDVGYRSPAALQVCPYKIIDSHIGSLKKTKSFVSFWISCAYATACSGCPL